MRLEFAQSRVRLRDAAAGSLAMMGNNRTVALSWRLQSKCTMHDKPGSIPGACSGLAESIRFTPSVSSWFSCSNQPCVC